MNILYVTSESPIFPAGGIGTYIGYAAEALQAAGHNIYLLTWTYSQEVPPQETWLPFKDSNVRIIRASGDKVWNKFPDGPYNHAFSYYIAEEIISLCRLWRIDTVEAADYLSPALYAFNKIRGGHTGLSTVCATFNHGLLDESYRASQIGKSLGTACDLAAERQQCRLSHVVIAPSLNASSKLRAYGIHDIVRIQEPFVFDKRKNAQSFSGGLTHLGRASIAKGIDKYIFVANTLNSIYPIERLTIIGKLTETPFRKSDMLQYIETRLNPVLRKKLLALNEVPRETAISLLRAGDACAHLSQSETFSYSFLESIDSGLWPIVEDETAISEFFPSELHEFLLEPRFKSVQSTIAKLNMLLLNGSSIVNSLQEHLSTQLSPKRFSDQISDLYGGIQEMLKGRATVAVSASRSSPRATKDDITILIPAFRPTQEFYETIDSLAKQTCGTLKVMICDDGNSEEDQVYLNYARLRISDLVVISQTNSGLLGARNTLISNVTTRLAVFLDTDDILTEDFIDSALTTYNASSCNAVIPNRKNFFQSGEGVIRILIGDHIHLITNDYRMTSLIETECLRSIGFDLTRRNGEADDWAFWVEFSTRGFHAMTLDGYRFRYRFKEGSMSWPWSEGQRIGTQAMLEEALKGGLETMSLDPETAQFIQTLLHAATTKASLNG